MTKHLVSELEGALLDHAVAIACGPDFDGPAGVVLARMRLHGETWLSLWEHRTLRFRPSTDWSQGGPIIERNGIDLQPRDHERPPKMWIAYHFAGGLGLLDATGPTPLIAAMRVVASHFGREVDL